MRLNEFDQDQLFKGYYESLLVGNNFSSRMWEVKEKKNPKGTQKLSVANIIIKVKGLSEKALKANQSIIFKNEILTTNAWGMRDRYYPLKKDNSTLRIAFLGGSNEMGSGVGDLETYENIIEDSLNLREHWLGYDKIEIMNFSVSSIHIPQHVGVLEERILKFKPDVLLYSIHNIETDRSIKSFAQLARKNILHKYPNLEKIIKEAGVKKGMKMPEMLALLNPHAMNLIKWGVDQLSLTCKENNIIPVCLLAETLGEGKRQNRAAEAPLLKLFSGNDFHILNTSGVFGDRDYRTLTISEWDFHFNVEAHQIIANAIISELDKNTDLINVLKNLKTSKSNTEE